MRNPLRSFLSRIDAWHRRLFLKSLAAGNPEFGKLIVHGMFHFEGRLTNFSAGDRVHINRYVVIDATERVHVGSDVHLSYGAKLITTGLEPSPELRQRHTAKPIRIEDNAWIGAGAVILGGVTVGESSIVGAGAVVTRDIPPKSIAVGSPAKVIKSLQ